MGTMGRYAALAIVATILLATALPVVQSDDGHELPNFKKMRVKELKKILTERDVDAKGVAEKSELVQLVQDNYHLPIVEEDVPEPPKEMNVPKMDDDELENMLKKLQKDTGSGFKVFKKGDDMDDFLKNMGGDKEKTNTDKKKSKKTFDKMKENMNSKYDTSEL